MAGGDAWTRPSSNLRTDTPVEVKKYLVTAVTGRSATLDMDGAQVPNIHLPANLTPTPGQWLWCILQGTSLWPFAVD